MVYDRTCVGRPLLPGLSHAWGTGAWLYRALGRFDAHYGARDWGDALGWLGQVDTSRPIREIQYWGHGKWGEALIDRKGLDAAALKPGHRFHEHLCRIRERLLRDDEALWWFRTCELFGAQAGLNFASAWTRFFGCRTAGHTFIIGHWQSGLHTLRPGEEPSWDPSEGLESGTPEAPEKARWSGRRQPNTISFLHGEIPAEY